jgi:DNA-binding transcriptional ArsR family regulator
MGIDVEPDESTSLAPDEAFDVLGSETRLQVLQVLAEADGPLTYSELFDRIAYEDSANFTYHLDKLLGHFVRKTDEGYVPRLAGQRVVEAIFSGVVTDAPVVERTDVEMSCMYCGGPTEMAYYDEVAVVYCQECEGRIGERGLAEEWPISASDIVGYVSIPPAGVYDRSATEILDAAGVWTVAGVQAIVRGVCPQCSATIERSPRVCGDHDDADEFCEHCKHRFAVSVDVVCTNCPFTTKSPYPTHALGNVDLMSFMTGHGIDPFASDAFHLRSCTEELLSTDPLRARYTFTTDGDALTLTVDKDLNVVEVMKDQAGGSA